jgi:hypothetical protein
LNLGMATRSHQLLMNFTILQSLPTDLAVTTATGAILCKQAKAEGSCDSTVGVFENSLVWRSFTSDQHRGMEVWSFLFEYFQVMWQEWAQHLFCGSATPFCQSLDPSFQSDIEVNTFPISILLLIRPMRCLSTKLLVGSWMYSDS